MDSEIKNVFGLQEETSRRIEGSKFERANAFINVMKVLNVLISIAVGGGFYVIMHEISYREWEMWMFLAIVIGIINLIIGKLGILILSMFVDMCQDISIVRNNIEKR